MAGAVSFKVAQGKTFGLFRLFFFNFLFNFFIFVLFCGLFVYYRRSAPYISKRFIPSNWNVSCWSYTIQVEGNLSRGRVWGAGNNIKTSLRLQYDTESHSPNLRQQNTALSISIKSCPSSIIISLKQTLIKVRATLKRKRDYVLHEGNT